MSCFAVGFVARRGRRRDFSFEFGEIIIARDINEDTVTAAVAAAAGCQSFGVGDGFGCRRCGGGTKHGLCWLRACAGERREQPKRAEVI